MRKLLVAHRSACWPAGLFACRPGFAQALPNINSLSVRYNTRKAAVKPEGELKAQIDAVDKAIAEASRLGNIGEVRRQIAKGLALLDKARVDAAARLPEFAGAAERAHGDRFVGAVRAAPRADLPPGDRADAGTDREGRDAQARAAAARRDARRLPPLAARARARARSTASAATCASRRSRWSSISPASKTAR